MQISLVRTGGFIPLKKRADAEVDWTEDELMKLIDVIKRESTVPSASRDNTGYQLHYAGQAIPIDLDRVPDAYQSTFNYLKDNLAPVKT